MEMYTENWIHHYDSQLFKNCMDSRIEHRSFSVCFFISLPACCVFSGKDDRLVDVLLRVEDLAPPVTRTITTILPTTTKNNNWNNKNINVLFRVEDLAPPSIAILLRNCLQRNQPATTTITQTGMFFSVTHLNIICKKAHLQFSRARVGTGTETWLTG